MSKNHHKYALAAIRERWPSADLLSAEGGNSWVFKVKDSEPLAIKVLRRSEPQRYARFKEELRLVEKLTKIEGVVIPKFSQLPEAPNASSGCRLSSLAFYGMKLFERGTSAQAHLRGPATDGGWKVVQAVLAITQILIKIHALGLAHRDLKPENILLDERGGYWISDFGQAIDLATMEERGFQTLEEEVVGAFWYRASEYLRGRLGRADHRRGDVFSVGRMLWAFLRGAHPVGMTDIEFAEARVSGLVPGLRRATMLDQLILDATNPTPGNRPSVQEIRLVLEEWMSDPKPGSPERIRDLIASDERAIAERQRASQWRHLNDALAQSQGYATSQMTSSLGGYLTELGDGIAGVSGGGPPAIDGVRSLIPVPHASCTLRYSPETATAIIPTVYLSYRTGFATSRQSLVDEVIACVVELGKEAAFWHSNANEFHSWNAVAMSKLDSRLSEATAWIMKYFEKIGT